VEGFQLLQAVGTHGQSCAVACVECSVSQPDGQVEGRRDA
jgi:hypothetical protein